METLKIKNFKCLNDVKIEGLKRVNLFTGMNNTGKSTIIEAISLFASKGNNAWLLELLRVRGEITNYTNEFANEESNMKLLSTFFSDRKISFTKDDFISIKCDSDVFEMGFVEFKVVGKIRLEDKSAITEKGITNDGFDKIKYGLGVKTNEQSRVIFLEERLFRQFVKLDEYNFHFINANGYNNKNNALLWDKIILTEKENLVIDALKIIEPDIGRLSFVGDEIYKDLRYPIVKLADNPELVPLKSMGDGINRILTIILALVNSDSGFLLIDEFENGLHYSAQEKLWKVIFETSKRLDVQVFVTTHSNDTINSFAKVLEEGEDDDGNLYRFARKKDKIKAFSFLKDEIIVASHQEINLR